MASTNYEWAALVMVRCSPPISPTANNCGNFTRWMGAENPRADWWHKFNPLNCGLDDGSADGEGSYPNLDIAATKTAKVLSQSNMAAIANALRANASTAAFSAGCAASPWSTGYHGKPGFIASVPQEAVIASPFTFPSAGPTPAPQPTPSPVPHPPIQQESDMSWFASDPKTGGVWATDPNGDLYPTGGAPFVAALSSHPDYHAGSAESGGTNPCVGMAYWSAFGNDGVMFFTQPTNGQGGWDGSTKPGAVPYDIYRFLRSGSPA